MSQPTITIRPVPTFDPDTLARILAGKVETQEVQGILQIIDDFTALLTGDIAAPTPEGGVDYIRGQLRAALVIGDEIRRFCE